MTYLKEKKEEYRIPLIAVSASIPDMLCQSTTDGGIEDLGEEEWTL